MGYVLKIIQSIDALQMVYMFMSADSLSVVVVFMVLGVLSTVLLLVVLDVALAPFDFITSVTSRKQGEISAIPRLN